MLCSFLFFFLMKRRPPRSPLDRSSAASDVYKRQDPIAVEDIQSIVATLKHKNIGVIITDHNVDETLAITDRTYLLYEGKILKTGTAEELAADPMVRKVYLGQHFELKKSHQLTQEMKNRKTPQE